ncbi:MAG: hypothetical protein VYD64_00010, partial [Pseudomonadota bacterium]|nr:hypothetical protein [Pseudomonadota bacterium]
MKTRRTAHLILAGTMLATGLNAAMPAAQAAEAAGQFLKRLEGEYRGRGSAMLPGRDDAEKVTCQLTNHYDADGKTLVVKGKCASAQAKSSVSGKMMHDGDSVSGSLISSAEATVTKSSGSVSGGKLTVTTNFVDNTTGRLTRTLQVIRHAGSGFEA